MPLNSKQLVVGVGGGIAAFKAATLVRELARRGARVRVAMTRAATRFVGPTTFAGLTGEPVLVDLFEGSRAGEAHVGLGEFADAMIIAPATMNLLARAAAGMADDAVLATAACARGPLFYAPAMHTRMWLRPATQRNVESLAADGAQILGPAEGALASGESGLGRMWEAEDIADAVGARLGSSRDLVGLRLLVSAGPTLEDLDDVRFLGNRSSGKMGYAVARVAARRGASVTLVSGPTQLSTPAGVERLDVRSALQMREALRSRIQDADALVMAAAVADYRPAERVEGKLEKSPGPRTLELVRTPDILAELGAAREARGPLLVGFAVESKDLVARARAKLERKRLDLIVANHASVGFAGDTNQATLIDAQTETGLPELSKTEVAERILDALQAKLEARRP
ncbi:MAG: bifunctional phosphopantothenoylcysteine decarboxylase/phosphopantothenate--cysteine ligase CoaBC [Deltaproteobacteria bacterium]|nr:bifunctional phosphopantothenoylcysteine decarboxylase/phosphopantothenate--cysteine ligase CoaBC [Deltaproteobacteria bacterium]